jgi:cytochrome c-type biogenesis protein CcmH
VAGGAALLALALYLAVGRPQLPDQPFAERVRSWRAAPERIGPNEAAAVLESIVRSRPADPEGHTQLGRARLAGGDAFGAVRALETAVRLDPDSAARWADLGRGMLALDPPAAEDAQRALRRALALAPGDPNARYWLGHALVAGGDTAGGVAEWRGLAAGLAPSDPRRPALGEEIAAAQARPEDPAVAAMVESLAARLKAEPDDPEGWARLARSYAVLGREADLAATLAEARRRFSGERLARIEAEAAAGRRLQGGR